MNEWEQGREKFQTKFQRTNEILYYLSWFFFCVLLVLKYYSAMYRDALYEFYQTKQVTHHYLLFADEYHRIALFWSM